MLILIFKKIEYGLAYKLLYHLNVAMYSFLPLAFCYVKNTCCSVEFFLARRTFTKLWSMGCKVITGFEFFGAHDSGIKPVRSRSWRTKSLTSGRNKNLSSCEEVQYLQSYYELRWLYQFASLIHNNIYNCKYRPRVIYMSSLTCFCLFCIILFCITQLFCTRLFWLLF